MTGWKKGSCRFSLLLSPFKGAEIPFPTMSPSTMAAKAQPHYRGQALIVFLLTTGNELRNIRLTRIIESEAFQSIGDLIPYESFIYNLIIEKQF